MGKIQKKENRLKLNYIQLLRDQRKQKEINNTRTFLRK